MGCRGPPVKYKVPSVCIKVTSFEGAQLLHKVFCASIYSYVKTNYRICCLVWFWLAYS